MGPSRLLAQPLWVNLLALVPLSLYFALRRRGIQISWRQFLFATIFALAFGFVEATVAVYLARIIREVIASDSHWCEVGCKSR